jgi:hypothetical protein
MASNLELLKSRYVNEGGVYKGPKAWYVDNPSEVSQFLKRGNAGGSFTGFDDANHIMLVLADPFHVIYNVGLTMRTKHAMNQKFMGQLTDALFALDEDNEAYWEEYLVQSGRATKRDLKDGKWRAYLRRNCRKYMHTLGDEDEKASRIAKVR